jgi:hypothetical protein
MEFTHEKNKSTIGSNSVFNNFSLGTTLNNIGAPSIGLRLLIGNGKS